MSQPLQTAPQYGYQVPQPGQQPMYYYPQRPATPGTNGLALVALILSIKSLFIPGVGIAAAIVGHKARTQIRTTGETGEGMALAGIVIGWSATALWGMFIALWVALMIFSS